VIARIFHAKRTGESVLPNPAGRFTDVEPVLQETVECTSREGVPSETSSSFGDPDFALDVLPRQSCRQPGNTPQFEIQREDLADERSLLFIGDELPCFEIVS